MKITLDLSNSDFIKILRESETFAEMIVANGFDFVKELEEDREATRDEVVQFLKARGTLADNLVPMVKAIRDEKKYFPFIKKYCSTYEIEYSDNTVNISLATAKHFVEHILTR